MPRHMYHYETRFHTLCTAQVSSHFPTAFNPAAAKALEWA